MSDQAPEFSTQKINPQLIEKIVEVLRNKAYGSIEIFIENYNVVQITERTITKLARPKSQKRFTISVRRGSPFAPAIKRTE